MEFCRLPFYTQTAKIVRISGKTANKIVRISGKSLEKILR